MNAMVEIKSVTKHFGETVALDNVSLDIEEGQFFALVGPSGSGKTTLLHTIGGFIAPTGGRILINGQDITHLPPAKRPTTSMFQDYALFPHMSVGNNVGFGLLMRKVTAPERKRRIKQALEMVNLAGMENRRIHQLSGGQQQRIALARALVVEPQVLLLDEPLGALDLNLRRQMQEELLHIQKKVGTTFIHVTHDQEEAMSIADRMAVMSQGRLEDVGSPGRIYLKPKTKFTATFMGESNMFEGQVVEKAGDFNVVETAMGNLQIRGDFPTGRAVQLSVRPEQFSPHPNTTESYLFLGEMRVDEVTFFGTHHRCTGQHLNTDQSLTIRRPQEHPTPIGEVLGLYVNRDAVVLLEQ
jgi:spermidine/putrescine transport system ATP-binding protein